MNATAKCLCDELFHARYSLIPFSREEYLNVPSPGTVEVIKDMVNLSLSGIVLCIIECVYPGSKGGRVVDVSIICSSIFY
jgi:hypothetical protein